MYLDVGESERIHLNVCRDINEYKHYSYAVFKQSMLKNNKKKRSHQSLFLLFSQKLFSLAHINKYSGVLKILNRTYFPQNQYLNGQIDFGKEVSKKATPSALNCGVICGTTCMSHSTRSFPSRSKNFSAPLTCAQSFF